MRVKEFMDYGYTTFEAKKAIVDRLYLVAYYKAACQLLNECVDEGHKQ